MTGPAASNNRRYDLSDRLIHFFRDVDVTSDDAPATPEHWGYSSINEDVDMPAFFLLRHCIRQGRIWATWSFRGGQRTIHGPRPAVCFTEMPIAAFLETSRDRQAKGQAISSYALVLPKRPTFGVGARPVIYGLSTGAWATTDPGTGERRFPDAALPSAEQYRYVAYDPSSGKLDWTHEREWRWPSDEIPWSDPDGIPPSDSDDIPGLGIDAPVLRGIGVVVRTADQADRVVYDILTKVDRGDVREEHYQFILASETVSDWDTLRNPDDLEAAIYGNLVDLAPFFVGRRRDAEQMAAELDRIAQEVEADTPRAKGAHYHEDGGCWLWLRDNRHPIVRALVRLGRVHVGREGRYLVDLPLIDRSRPLQQRQEMIDAVAARLAADYNLPGTYYGVRDSWDPEALPSFHNDDLADDFFYNFSFHP